MRTERIPIEAKWFANVHETALTKAQAAIENGFQNEAGGHSRFPGHAVFCTLPGDNGRVYLHDWRGNLMAATSSGNLFKVDRNGAVANVTGVPISGGLRVIFGKTTDELLLAAGRKPIRFAGEKTEILSEDAPDTTHIGFIDNYAVAIERHSGRFLHCEAGEYRTWSPLDVFSADTQPDPLNGLLVTRFRELMLTGPDSIEQFERLTSGETPFYRRWSVGDGNFAPYGQIFADNALWYVNPVKEFSRVSGQSSRVQSDDIAQILEGIDDWTDFWVGGHPDKPLGLAGQNFILMQAPHATNPYGSKGVTLLYDYRRKRWYSLYAWDASTSIPSRWPGWSHWSLWNDTFIGGEGVIYKVTRDAYTWAGEVQRMLGRTAHLGDWGPSEVTNLRARLRRGTGTNTAAGEIRIRAIRDGGDPTPWVSRSFGLAGEREFFVDFDGFGCADTWQFEWVVTDDCPVEVVRLDAMVERLEW
jgi:hypothetical protein